MLQVVGVVLTSVLLDRGVVIVVGALVLVTFFNREAVNLTAVVVVVNVIGVVRLVLKLSGSRLNIASLVVLFLIVILNVLEDLVEGRVLVAGVAHDEIVLLVLHVLLVCVVIVILARVMSHSAMMQRWVEQREALMHEMRCRELFHVDRVVDQHGSVAINESLQDAIIIGEETNSRINDGIYGG